MKKQIETGLSQEPKKENISKFKGALKTIKSKVRSRLMPIVLGSLIAISPAFSQEMPLMAQLEKAHPELVKDDALMRILYINSSNTKRKVSDGMRKVVENISRIIEKNKGNRIFCMTLNPILREVLENAEEKDYFLTADGSTVTVKDSASNPTKIMTIGAYEDGGVQVEVFYLGDGAQKSMAITPKSTSNDVGILRLETSKFFDTLISDLILINLELEENRKR